MGKAPVAILIMGPTASGKSALAMALARQFPAEIISVDSAQAYRGMDVGTAKPSASERHEVPHHLIDIIDPTEAYSTARFAQDAQRLMAEITSRGRVPLLVGGTMLYFKGLREGLSHLPQADPAIRAELDARAAEVGWAKMHAELARIDPQTAARLEPGDSQRIQRALEVFQIAGEPLSKLQGRRANNATSDTRYLPIALVPGDRSVLHRRIEARFGQMLAAGLVDELRDLRKRHSLTAELPSMRTVGYRQAWAHLEGEYDAAELKNRGIYATRQLAKRQLTWLRSMKDLHTFDCLATDLTEQVRALVERELNN